MMFSGISNEIGMSGVVLEYWNQIILYLYVITFQFPFPKPQCKVFDKINYIYIFIIIKKYIVDRLTTDIAFLMIDI